MQWHIMPFFVSFSTIAAEKPINGARLKESNRAALACEAPRTNFTNGLYGGIYEEGSIFTKFCYEFDGECREERVVRITVSPGETGLCSRGYTKGLRCVAVVALL